MRRPELIRYALKVPIPRDLTIHPATTVLAEDGLVYAIFNRKMGHYQVGNYQRGRGWLVEAEVYLTRWKAGEGMVALVMRNAGMAE